MALSSASGAADPPRSFAQAYLTWVFIALAGFIPICLFLGARGIAPSVGVAGLACLPFARPSREGWPGVVVLVLLTALAGISVAWSPAPNLHVHAAKDLSRLTVLHLGLQLALCTALVAAAARLTAPAARRALTALAVGLLAAQALLIEEGLSHAALYLAMMKATHNFTRPDLAIRTLAQGGHVSAMLAWPLGMALVRRGRLWIGGAIAMAAFVPVCALLMRGFGPSAALAASLPAFFVARRYGRPAILVLLGLTIAVWLLTPLAMLVLDHYDAHHALGARLPPSWSERLRIWSFVVEQFTLHPLRGAGLDASRTFPGIVPLHPHNGPLQLWYELGMFGAWLGATFWAWLWWRIAEISRDNRPLAAVYAATATVYIVMGIVDFGLWQEWWICLGALAMAACVALSKIMPSARAEVERAPVSG